MSLLKDIVQHVNVYKDFMKKNNHVYNVKYPVLHVQKLMCVNLQIVILITLHFNIGTII